MTQILNALVSHGQTKLPIEIATNRKENLKNFQTFGCQVWVQPSTSRSAKFQNDSQKGMFLGFAPNTTQNIPWFNVDTERVKIAKHTKFDEGMNDIPLDQLPPNAMQPQHLESGHRLPPDEHKIASSNLFFIVSPFDAMPTKEIQMQCNSETFGSHPCTDEINQRTHIHNITPNSSAGKSLNFAQLSKNGKREPQGSCVTAMNGTPAFDKESVITKFQKVQKAIENGSIDTFANDIAPLPKTPQKSVWRECDEHNIFVPDPREDNSEDSISIDPLKSIAKLCANTTPHEDHPSCEAIVSAINALRSAEVTPEEQALGHHARQKLETLENWPQWLASKLKQLDQFHDLEMCGEPCPLPPNGVLLCSHWQCQVHHSGERQLRQCCDGSKRAAPMLHAIAKTCSSCVEQPVQHLFIALSAQLGHALFGGNAKGAFAHSPPPECPTFVQIDDAHANWCENKFGKPVDHRPVSPAQHALQGHPEPRRPLKEHINKMLADKTLNF